MVYPRQRRSQKVPLNSLFVALSYSTFLLGIVTNCYAFLPSRNVSPIVRHTSYLNQKNNVLTRVFSSATTGQEIQPGLSKVINKKGYGDRLQPGDIVLVKYSCSVPSMPPFAKASKQKVQVASGGGVFIKGWDIALSTMSVGERATIYVQDAEAFGYGAAGVPPFIPSNSVIEMDIEVLEIQDSSELLKLDASGLLSNSESAKPRTPAAIAAAYQSRQDEAGLVEEKEGLEGLIEKLKGFYFFGFFEGETGQKAPWYLRPGITFPLAFLVVGAAFAVSVGLNAISERGMPSTDELDDIVLSSNYVKDMLVYSLMVKNGVDPSIHF